MKKEIFTGEEIEEALEDPKRYSLNKRLDIANKNRFKKSFKNLIKWFFVYFIYILFNVLFSILKFENHFDKKTRTPKKFIVFKLEHIGDVILSTPVYREIKKVYPKCKLYVVTTPNIEDTLINNPYIDKIIHINPRFTNRSLNKISFVGKIKIDLKNFLNLVKIIFIIRPDIAISLRNDYQNIFLNYFSGAKIRIGHSITAYNYMLTNPVNYNGDKHEIERNLELLKEIGIKTDDKELNLFPTKKEYKFVKTFFKKNSIKEKDLVVSIHIGGSGNLKWWPIERFVKIAEYLIEKYKAKIIIIGKGNDEEIEGDKLKDRFEENISKSFDSTILQKAALIKKSDLLICNDSGPMHIGAAMKTPMIAMFGPGNYKYYKPLEKIHTVIYKHLKCSPCAPFVQDEKNDCPDNICMKLITMKEVIKEIDNKLNKFINLQSFNHSNEWKRSN